MQIGGGASGSVLARRLSDKGHVLLLERGSSPTSEPGITLKVSRCFTSPLTLLMNGVQAQWPLGISEGNADNVRTEGGEWTLLPNVLGGGSALNVRRSRRFRS